VLHVVDSRGRPVAGAKVTRHRQSLVTDESGEVRSRGWGESSHVEAEREDLYGRELMFRDRRTGLSTARETDEMTPSTTAPTRSTGHSSHSGSEAKKAASSTAATVIAFSRRTTRSQHRVREHP